MFLFVIDKRREMQVRKIFKDYPTDFKTKLHKGLGTIVIKTLQDIGVLSFLDTPRTINEIMDHFEYKDQDYVTLVLDTLADDHFLVKEDHTYRNTELLLQILSPKVMNEMLAIFSQNSFLKEGFDIYSHSIPEKMKGKSKTDFTDKKSTYTWDAVLRNPMYELLRLATLAFGNALNRQGTFLDVGCGNGNGTLRIWTYYQHRHYFENNSKRKIALYGIDPSPELLSMAANEFDLWLSKELNQDRNIIKQTYQQTFPKFSNGSAHKIPFEDNFFDIVYASEVLHFDDTELALKEMYRVVKPGGIVIGNEIVDSYGTVTSQTIAGAKGSYSKESYYQILKNIKAKNIHLYEHHFLFFSYSK